MRQLTIFNLGEVKYGIWRNAAIAVKDIEHIHWLPPIPKHIAGMSILEGRTVTMFDLPACIGLSPLARKRQKYSVILFEHEKDVAGFLVDFIIGHFSISSETVHKMPDYLRTEVIDTCAVHNSELIPVISLSKLFKIVLQADFKPPEAELRIPEIQQDKTSLVNTVRIFKSGGEYFAVPSENIEKASVKPELVSNMTLTHKHVSGIIFHDGKLIPLIHISSRINEKKEQIYPIEKNPLVLINDIGGQSFGLLVDADRGEWDGINFDVKPLPPLVQSSWMKSAGVLGKDIIPIIDNSALLSERHDDDYWNSLPQRYTADSNVKTIFGRDEVKVIEFSFLGLRHALPDSEVKDSFKVRAYRRLPNVIPIVAGVTEHDGKLLPVLDLGMYFGRCSPVTPEWWMILVKNGDFHALILAEAVLGKRLLPVNIQQELPFEEPHTIVYGCYPDEAAIRLVLNVEAMTVHFDEVRFKELISMLAEGVEQAPEEIGPAILELEAAELAIEPEAETAKDTISEEIKDEQKPEEIEVIEQVEEILEPIEPEDSIDLIDLIEPEESIGLIEPVVSKETDKKEEEESQVEPEKQVYLEEVVEFEVESETEESKIEVTEETKRESEIEEIGVIENRIEPEDSIDLIDLIEPEESVDLIDVIEPVVSKETEKEEEEIQVEAEEPVHEKEAVELAIEPEVETAEDTISEEIEDEQKLEEIEVIEQVEEILEPIEPEDSIDLIEPEDSVEPIDLIEPEESIGLIEPVVSKETEEEEEEIQVEAEEPVHEKEVVELAIEPEAETAEDTISEEIEDEQKLEEIEVIEQVEEILEPIEPEDSIEPIDLIEPEESIEPIDLIEPEESIGLIEPVVSKETEEEEKKIQVEAEEPVHEKEAVELVIEPEAETAEDTISEEIEDEQKPEEIEVIEQVEEIIEPIEPELEEFIGLVESLMKEETEEVKEIQEQGEIPITEVEMKAAENEETALLEKDSETVVMPEETALSLTDMRDHLKTEPFGKTTRWPFLIILAALSFFLLLIPALYFFGVLDNWIGKKDKGKIETSALVRTPLPGQIETPKFLTPKDSTKTTPTPAKSQKSFVSEKPTVISHKPIEPLKPVEIKKPSKASPVPTKPQRKQVPEKATPISHKPIEPLKPVGIKKLSKVLPAPTKPQKKQMPEKVTPISIAPVKSLKPSTPEKPPTISHWTVVYTVKRGDTLFKITKKYTGDGYDFPEIAKRNKIKNQDLIYPGQKIQLKR